MTSVERQTVRSEEMALVGRHTEVDMIADLVSRLAGTPSRQESAISLPDVKQVHISEVLDEFHPPLKESVGTADHKVLRTDS
jgi:hypothetical protein